MEFWMSSSKQSNVIANILPSKLLTIDWIEVVIGSTVEG